MSSGELQSAIGSGDQPRASATPAAGVVRKGWNGRYFEDFVVGDLYEHPLGRTVLPTDNAWFTLLTQNTAPLHFDRHYAEQTAWGEPVVDSTFTLALVTGQSVTDVSRHVFANLTWDHVELPHPVFEGDTIYSRSRVLDAQPSKSRPEVGIVRVRTEGYNQDGVIVIRFERTVMVYRRGQGPIHSRPTVNEPAPRR
jgi:itaconyl-CoA hydratase